MRWARHVARFGEKRNAYRILVGKPERKRLIGRPRRRCVILLKWMLEDGMVWYGLDLSGSEECPLASSCEHGNEILGCIKCWEILE
jgi:hypothetical protein